MNKPTAPTDPGALILRECGLGCFVSDGDDWKRPAIYDSIRYFRMFWVEREARFRVNDGKDNAMQNWSDEMTETQVELLTVLNRAYELYQRLCDNGLDGIAEEIVTEAKRQHAQSIEAAREVD